MISVTGDVFTCHDEPLHIHVTVDIIRTVGDKLPDVGHVEVCPECT
jgi:hypothetical protein